MRKITPGSVFFMTILFLGLIFSFISFKEIFAVETTTCQEVCKNFGWQYGIDGMSVHECSDDVGDCTGYPKFDGGYCYYDCEQGSSGIINIPDCDSNTCTCIKKTLCDSSENNCYDEDGCYACETRKSPYSTGQCANNKDCCESASVFCDTTTGFCYNPDNNFSCISSRDCYSDEECMSEKCDFEGTGECECSDRGGMCEDYNSHCAGDLRCNDDYNVCYDPDLTNLVGGDSCFYDRECASRVCDFNAEGTVESEGKCLGVDRGKECENNTDCASGLLCNDTYCYDPAATLNDGVKCYHDDECKSEICDFDADYETGIGRCAATAVEPEEEEPEEEEPEDEPEPWPTPKPKPPRGSSACNDYCFYGIEPPDGTICICNPLSADSFEEIIDNIINFIFNIALVLGPLMIVWAGGLYVTSGGKPEQTTKAKNIIIYTLTGFAVILLSKGFVAIIKQLLGV